MMHLTRSRGWLAGLTAAALAATGVAAGVASAAAPASTATTPATATATPAAATTPQAGRIRALLRLEHKLATGAVHGEIVLDTKKGLQTLDFQRGTISNATSGSFTLTDANA